MRFIDSFLNKITMYRLMLYYLEVLFGAAIIFSFFKLIPYDPLNLLLPGFYLIGLCFTANQLFGRIFKVKPNFESQYITALILILIIGPLPLKENIEFLTLAGVIAMASKYVIAVNKQHIFNPAAFAVVITALFLNQGASWWVGDAIMLPLVVIGGLLILHKTNRFNLVFGFLLSSTVLLVLFNKLTPQAVPSYIMNPTTLFFAFVMLTEPITSPADRKVRMYFGLFTGAIMVIFQAVFAISYAMELALISANLFGRLVRFSIKHQLILKEKKQLKKGIWEFLFTPTKPFTFIPGQFLEWSLPHRNTDARGNRRYFTISSSPTEKEIILTVRVPEKPSSYKKALLELKSGDPLYATNLEGEFVLAKEQKAPSVFIAGGIGITPFRSIIKYLLDNNLSVPITLFYIAHTTDEFVFDEVFAEAKKKLGLHIVHVISENPPAHWQGEVGRLDETMVKKHVKNIDKQTFYLSGPPPMVDAYKDLLKKMGIKKIKTDYFPGYA